MILFWWGLIYRINHYIGDYAPNRVPICWEGPIDASSYHHVYHQYTYEEVTWSGSDKDRTIIQIKDKDGNILLTNTTPRKLKKKYEPGDTEPLVVKNEKYMIVYKGAALNEDSTMVLNNYGETILLGK